ncbi:phosphodiesterase [Nocardioides silvaticus]|uniref:Phosphodiesterase n=1 Tax=Nocardioides silvaticus TaxID=2201891 RepID=A0A316TF59_9ACTN|nr:phosphodiesterase [Nocardioides silvaticus]PWN00954.1 phosphodiesterase [Nocardioides silvaticus]
MQYGQHPAPRFTIAHLSDPHLLANDAKQYGVVAPESGLVLALDRLTRLDPRPQALVFTGDLADKAEPEAYARLREVVEPAAEALGAQVVWVMGNHDERAPFAKALFDSDDDGPQDRVHDLGGLRIVALDTSVPGFHHGELTDDQLDWLRDLLSTPAEHGTILAMHHPPIPTPTMEVAAIIELFDQHRLAAVIEGTDVRQVLGGHYHYSSHSTFAGVPVSVASASCYTTDPAPLDRLISGVDGHQAFTTVHVYDDRIVHTVIPLHDAPEVSGQPPSVTALLESLTAEERHDIISRKDSEFNADWDAQDRRDPLTDL